MNNKSIVKYTEQRYYKHTEQSVKKFVDKKFKSKNNFLFGIFFHKKHIGNIKLGPIIKIEELFFIFDNVLKTLSIYLP